ncbi:MAG: MFS transporter [Oscillospiraceae bacterium]|nr:MFS transporter [Oscillospiraceae bacterium]
MKKKQWYPFAMLGCAAMVNLVYMGLIYNMLGLYTPSILQEFPDFSRSSFTVTMTLINLMAAAANMIHTPVREKIHVKGMPFLSLVLAAGGVFLYHSAHSLVTFYAGGILIGLAGGFCGTATSSMMVNAWFARHTGAFVSIVMSGTGIGVALFSPVVSGMIDRWGWRNAYAVTGTAALVLGLFMALLYRDGPAKAGLASRWGEKEQKGSGQEASGTADADEKQIRKKKRPVWKQTVYRVYLLQVFLMGIVLFSIMNNLSVIATDMNFSILEIGMFSSVIFAANVISQLPVGLSCDRFGSEGILYIMFGLMAGICLLFLFVPSVPLAGMLISSAVFGCAKTVMNNLTVYLVQEIAGEEERSQVVSLGVAFMSFGCAVGVYMVQLGYDLCGSYRSIYVLYIVLAALCMVLTRYLRNHRRNSAI